MNKLVNSSSRKLGFSLGLVASVTFAAPKAEVRGGQDQHYKRAHRHRRDHHHHAQLINELVSRMDALEQKLEEVWGVPGLQGKPGTDGAQGIQEPAGENGRSTLIKITNDVAYEALDNTQAALVTALTARVSDLEAVVNALVNAGL